MKRKGGSAAQPMTPWKMTLRSSSPGTLLENHQDFIGACRRETTIDSNKEPKTPLMIKSWSDLSQPERENAINKFQAQATDNAKPITEHHFILDMQSNIVRVFDSKNAIHITDEKKYFSVEEDRSNMKSSGGNNRGEHYLLIIHDLKELQQKQLTESHSIKFAVTKLKTTQDVDIVYGKTTCIKPSSNLAKSKVLSLEHCFCRPIVGNFDYSKGRNGE